MKFTIIFGSPRKHGNTASLLVPFMDELDRNGAEVEYFDVYEQNIAGCKACLGCQKDTESINCVIDDDMQPILHSIESADVIVYAAPTYIWSFPAPVKAVIDRSVYASCKYYGGDLFGPALMKGKRIAVITTCGYPTERVTDLFEEQMRRYCKHCGPTYAGMPAERQRNLKEAFMDEEKEMRARAFAKTLL